MKRALTPTAVKSSSASAVASSSAMSVKTMSWPASARASPMARPIPRRAPVIRATGRVISFSPIARSALFLEGDDALLGVLGIGDERARERLHHCCAVLVLGGVDQ